MASQSPQSAAESLGFSYAKKAPKRAHKPFAKGSGAMSGGTVRHYIEGSIEGRALRIGQHEYMLSTGSAVIPIMTTAYLLDAPQWPLVKIRRRQLLCRILRALGRRARIELENEQFNKQFRVECRDEAFAITLLTPDAQTLLLEKPSIKWIIGAGRIAMVYSGKLRADRMRYSLDRMRRFALAIPEELWDWTPEPQP